MIQPRALAVWLLAFLVTGCGGVSLLSIYDGRLPIESQRWIADSEDAVSVASAALQEAQASRRRALKLVQELRGQAKRISDAGGAQAASKMEFMAETRVAYVQLTIRQAEKELDLARAKQLLINATTAMRHDIAVYDLAPLTQSVDRQRQEATDLRRAVLKASLAAHRAAGKAWQVYAGWIRGGGDNKAFWLLEGERKVAPPQQSAKPAPST